MNLLSNIPLFSDLPAEELDKIVSTLEVRELKDKEILFREGDPGEEFYVVTRGEVEVLKAEGQAEEMTLNVLKVGEYCGEMSLILPGGHRTASVRARGAASLLSMSRAQFSELTRKCPRLSRSMARVL
ncbi:MAG: cyclic nucleotide-binding domain-containing protein, partial [Chloroflexi bacterium]|nr:cyclic nucleotide-binding domain-containing protein [Chloroflexota bacterium]